jgi:hypothetical protein
LQECHDERQTDGEPDEAAQQKQHDASEAVTFHVSCAHHQRVLSSVERGEKDRGDVAACLLFAS